VAVGDTKLPLRKWFMAIWLITNHPKGVASTTLAKDLKITQKSAWFVLHRLRHAARTKSFNAPLKGTTEVDQVHIGGREKNKHANKRKPGSQGGATSILPTAGRTCWNRSWPATATASFACSSSFSYRAASWTKPRRVVAKVEWHPGELCPRVGFIVTNLSRPVERVVAFYNQRGTAEQRIKEGKNAIKWTRLSCRSLAANAVRLQLRALAYNLGNFLRTLALPQAVEQWSLTTLREKLIKIGAKIVRHGRYVTFQMAEVAIPRMLFAEILRLIAELRPQPPPAPA
jgi:hypothetical protein